MEGSKYVGFVKGSGSGWIDRKEISGGFGCRSCFFFGGSYIVVCIC